MGWGRSFSDKGGGCGWGRREVFVGVVVDGSCSENFSDPGEEGRRLHASQEPPEAWGGGDKVADCFTGVRVGDS